MGLLDWFFQKDDDTLQLSDRGEYELVEAVPQSDEVGGKERGRLGIAGSSSRNVPSSDQNKTQESQYPSPTAYERLHLPRIADSLPYSTFLIAIVELCERFTYYGLSGPFQNYISNPYNPSPSSPPGALGLDQSRATALTNFFQFWCYFTPVLGAIIADQYLGKYRTILYSAGVYVIGVAVLFVTSLPAAIERGWALPGLCVAMVVIGVGTGGIKSNVSPLIAEQYQGRRAYVKTVGRGRGGGKVIVDPAVTVQRIYMVFYLCINVGSLSPIATTILEAKVGFWSAYLLCLGMFGVGFAVLVVGRGKYVLKPPRGSPIPKAMRICWIGMRNGGSLNAAKPEYLSREGAGRRGNVEWDSLFVEEVKRALVACKVFLFFPIYWLVYGQMLNNFISMAGQMQLHGIPNDMMQNLDPMTIIICIPLCDKFLYPGLRKLGIKFKPITRIFWGFMLGSAAMAYAAGVQKLIYASGPCYDAPFACSAALKPNGSYKPNNVHVAVQTPAYLLIGLSEIFASVTGLEYAFTKAPPSMKSFIMSLFLLTTAVGAALGGAISPFAVDPQLFWMYIFLGAACFVAGVSFWIIFHKLNESEDAMNELDQYGDKPVSVDDDDETGSFEDKP